MSLPHAWLAVLAGSLCALALGTGAAGDPPVVLITGATGRTGSLLYKALKEKGVTVRAFVRNATKAGEVLGCHRCDASEGIFVGDVSKEGTLRPAMEGATALAITTSSGMKCGETCTYPEGGLPVDVDWIGQKLQISTFAAVTNGTAPVVLCSTMGTTDPTGFLETAADGHLLFFKLNSEAFLMSSGLPFTIVKPCGLGDGIGGAHELVVGHDDEITLDPQTIARADVARVMLEALLSPEDAGGLRFDVCSRKGKPTTDFGDLFRDARYPWQQARKGAVVVV